MPQLQRLVFSCEQIHDTYVTLNDEQKRYLFKVLRLQANDLFIVMDGQGHWWEAQLNRDRNTAALITPIPINNELPIPLTLIAAPPKGKGFDDVVHSATELGVRHIYPLLSERTLVQPSAKKLQRWQTIAREATEQSLRQVVPNIHSPIQLRQLSEVLKAAQPQSVFFCSTQDNQPPLFQVLNQEQPFQQISIITGPEGGWNPTEEAKLQQMDYCPVSLGKRVLRAVTAPICALSLVTAYLDTEC